MSRYNGHSEDDGEESGGEELSSMDMEDDGLDDPSYIAMVLFREFPELDPEKLVYAINSLEPDEEDCQASEFSVGALEDSSEAAEFLPSECIGRRIGTGVIAWSTLRVAIVLHDWAPPEDSLAYAAPAAEALPAVGEALNNARAYALINCIDTESEMHPVERMIMLLKTGVAMAEQGALALANESNATFFPGELLVQLGKAARESAENASEDLPAGAGEDDEEEDDEDENLSLWDSLRGEGMPPELLVSLLPVEDERGQLWFVTRGHAQCELPELAYKAGSIAEYEQVDAHFKNAFSYMMENGPVLEPGHTLGYDEQALLRFSEPEEELEFLQAPFGTLLVSVERADG